MIASSKEVGDVVRVDASSNACFEGSKCYMASGIF